MLQASAKFGELWPSGQPPRPKSEKSIMHWTVVSHACDGDRLVGIYASPDNCRTGFYRASICEGGLGSRNSVCLSVTRVDCDKTK